MQKIKRYQDPRIAYIGCDAALSDDEMLYLSLGDAINRQTSSDAEIRAFYNDITEQHQKKLIVRGHFWRRHLIDMAEHHLFSLRTLFAMGLRSGGVCVCHIYFQDDISASSA